ncbi:MAG: Spy/CpxP family protein refolding chaperone [Planctomycetota bacterium]|jgi:Spy/CpxP family protein refolding chaperone|nr:Spy/CpxP family protein refolding chaperone [Planctomycetota bacterium]MDP7254042.1 Spy/CpxP family protein refolding chaperone [Planctomycetota bacterium]
MNTRIRLAAATTVLLGSFAITPLASAAEATGPVRSAVKQFMSGAIGRLLVLRSDLNVTDDQKSQIREIVSQHKASIGEVARKVMTKRRALRDLVRSEQPTENALRQASTELGNAIADAAILAAEVRGEVSKVLTPEQRNRIDEFVKGMDTSKDSLLQDILK